MNQSKSGGNKYRPEQTGCFTALFSAFPHNTQKIKQIYCTVLFLSETKEVVIFKIGNKSDSTSTDKIYGYFKSRDNFQVQRV
jgi:hypothetical protein